MSFTPRAGPYGTRLTVHRTAGCAVASPSSTTVVSTAVEHGGLGYRLPCSRSACSAPTGGSLPQRSALLPALRGGVSAPGEFYETPSPAARAPVGRARGRGTRAGPGGPAAPRPRPARRDRRCRAREAVPSGAGAADPRAPRDAPGLADP